MNECGIVTYCKCSYCDDYMLLPSEYSGVKYLYRNQPMCNQCGEKIQERLREEIEDKP